MNNTEIQQYMDYLFRAALKKCGNLQDAEDLTGEVLLCALQYPGDIANVKAWLSAVLDHKYYDMLRRKYRLPTVSTDLVPEESSPYETPEPDGYPDSAAVRREIAFLADKYRTVIVRHYLNGEKIRDLADSIGVPKGTVLSRLSVGREQMKKGLERMEPYEKQSYQPEWLDISMNGQQGFHGEPYSLVENNLMKQNVLIAAYDEPRTVVEIARALGIPTAYVENAVCDMTKSELMKQTGNRFFTDFMIVTPKQLLKSLDTELAFTETHYEELLGTVNAYLDELRKPDFMKRLSDTSRKKLEYYFILHLFSLAIYTATQRIVPSKETYPQRPDGGKWIAVGNRYPLDFDFENYRFGKYCYGGERISYEESYLGAKSIALHIYDTQPDLNRYERGPNGIDDEHLVRLLYILSHEIPIERTGFDVMYLKSIPHLTECGILGTSAGKLCVDIAVLNPEEYGTLDGIRLNFMRRMADMLEPQLREIFPALKIGIPKHLNGRIAEFRQYSCYAIPMAFMKKAIAAGDFDASGAVPPMVLVTDDGKI